MADLQKNYQSNKMQTIRNLKQSNNDIENSVNESKLSVIQSQKEEQSDDEKHKKQKTTSQTGRYVNSNSGIQKQQSNRTTAGTANRQDSQNTVNSIRQSRNIKIKRNSPKVQQVIEQQDKYQTIDIVVNVLNQRSKKFQQKLEQGDINQKFFDDYLHKNKHFQYSFYSFFSQLLQKDPELQPDLNNLKKGQLIKIENFFFQKYEDSRKLYDTNQKYKCKLNGSKYISIGFIQIDRIKEEHWICFRQENG